MKKRMLISSILLFMMFVISVVCASIAWYQVSEQSKTLFESENLSISTTHDERNLLLSRFDVSSYNEQTQDQYSTSIDINDLYMNDQKMITNPSYASSEYVSTNINSYDDYLSNLKHYKKNNQNLSDEILVGSCIVISFNVYNVANYGVTADFEITNFNKINTNYLSYVLLRKQENDTFDVIANSSYYKYDGKEEIVATNDDFASNGIIEQNLPSKTLTSYTLIVWLDQGKLENTDDAISDLIAEDNTNIFISLNMKFTVKTLF